MRNLLKEVCVSNYFIYPKEIDEDLHLLVLSKCHRVPLNDTIEELKNPSGILYSEYAETRKQLLKKLEYERNDNLYNME